jgi:hypothetical protein
MPIDSDVYNAIGQPSRSVDRLASIFDPTVIQARQLDQAKMRESDQQLQRASKLRDLLGSAQTADPAQLSGRLAQGGFADEALKYQGLADAQQQRADSQQQRRIQALTGAHSRIGAKGGTPEALMEEYSALGIPQEQIKSKVDWVNANIPPEGRAAYFLDVANPERITKREETQAKAVEAGEQKAADRQARAIEQKAAEDRFNQAEEGRNRRSQAHLSATAAQTNAILGGSKQFEAENKLRDEYQKGSGSFVKIRDAYGLVQAAAKDPSAAGDLSLIFAYMRTLDPNSVVREGEFATAQNAASVPDRVRNAYNKALSGERLNPEQRTDFVNNAKKIYEQQKVSQDKLSGEYKNLAKNYGLKESNIVTDYSADAPKSAAPVVALPPDVDVLMKKYGRK